MTAAASELVPRLGRMSDALERALQRHGPPRRPLTPAQRQALIRLFEGDIRLLESITGDDFSDWLAPCSASEAGGLVGARPAGQGQARNGQPQSF
jgi:hypothetical protein